MTLCVGAGIARGVEPLLRIYFLMLGAVLDVGARRNMADVPSSSAFSRCFRSGSVWYRCSQLFIDARQEKDAVG